MHVHSYLLTCLFSHKTGFTFFKNYSKYKMHMKSSTRSFSLKQSLKCSSVLLYGSNYRIFVRENGLYSVIRWDFSLPKTDFSFQNKSDFRNTDLNFWDCFGREQSFLYRIYLAIRRGFHLSRMTTNNLISSM